MKDQESVKLEFLMMVNDNIIVQRFFNVREFNPEAKNSLDLYELLVNFSDDIKYQLTIGSYGNDTMGFFLADGGIPTAIIATPLKYMHTTVEMAHKDDVESVIKMFIQSLKVLDKKTTS